MILNRKCLLGLFALFLLFGFCLSCSHTSNEAISGLDSHSKDSRSSSSNSLVMMPSASELSPYLSRPGLVWSPFILPLQTNYRANLDELLLGYRTEQGEFLVVPPPGNCQLLLPQTADEKKATYHFTSTQWGSQSRVALMLDDLSSAPVALLKLDHNGRAVCDLPRKSYRLSYGTGSLRKEFKMEENKKESTAEIPFDKKGTIHFAITQTSYLENGDLIRIGRKNVFVHEDLFQRDFSLIPSPILGDIFRESNGASHLLGIAAQGRQRVVVGIRRHPCARHRLHLAPRGRHLGERGHLQGLRFGAPQQAVEDRHAAAPKLDVRR